MVPRVQHNELPRIEAFLGALARVLIRAQASKAVIAGVCAAARDLRKGGRA